MDMSSFNLAKFLRFTRLLLLDTRKTNRRLTWKRVGWILVFYSLYPLLELVTWVGLGLDELSCGDYRQQEVRQPIFILGNPRSGTTFLHRLLARDRHTFVCMPTWEMLFAPSIVMRRACRWLASLDRRLGGRVHRLLAAGERYWQQKNYTHRQALMAPEEDENLLLHTWSGLNGWIFGAMLEEARPFVYYDQMVPRQERERAMAFYKRCLQRHLYVHGDSGATRRRYLAKNPAFNPRVESVLDQFPDAQFIYVARNPLDAIPSFVSVTKWVWDLLGDPVEYDSLCEYAIEMASHGYRYPLERLERLPQGRYRVLRFDDLVGDAERTVHAIYGHLGLDVPPAYARVLRSESMRARHYRSEHRYSLCGLGLSRERIVAECADVFERFGFDTREPWRE
jgi:hypothetical protein